MLSGPVSRLATAAARPRRATESLGSIYQRHGNAVLSPFVLATLVGVIAGVGAVILTELVDGLTTLSFDVIGEQLDSIAGRWTVILIPVLGGIPVVFLTLHVAHETKGHGVPEVMYAVEARGGKIRYRVPFVKALASAITIGTGGSVGREGPIVSIGAGLASIVGQWTRQSPETMVWLVAAGAAGGVSATFNAPIAGVFFALEVILRRFNVRNFSLVVTSSVVANLIAIGLLGDHPGIELSPHRFHSGVEVPLYLGLGVAAAVVGVVFIRVLYATEDLFERIPLSPYIRMLGGMLLLGAIGLWHGEIFGVGLDTIERAANGELAGSTLLILLTLKLIATTLTLSSGGSGGVFAPSLFMGTTLGAALGIAFNSAIPDIAPAGAFAVVGMAAVFAASARAPMTALFIVIEMTRDYSLVVPLMIGVTTATIVAQLLSRDTIYSIKLRHLGVEFTEERPSFAMDQISVAHAMRTDVLRVDGATDLSTLAMRLSEGQRSIAAIEDDQRSFRGLVSAADVAAALERGTEDLVARDLAVERPVSVAPGDSLNHVIVTLTEQRVQQLPVVAHWDRQRLLGVIDQQDVLRAFSEVASRRHAQPPPPTVERPVGAELIRHTITESSMFVGRRLDQVPMPTEAVVTEIERGGILLVPRGASVVLAGDRLTVLSEPQAAADVRTLLGLSVESAADR